MNVRGGLFEFALQAATYSAQTYSVRLLIEKKADANLRGGKYHSTLNAAIIKEQLGHCPVVAGRRGGARLLVTGGAGRGVVGPGARGGWPRRGGAVSKVLGGGARKEGEGSG